MAFLFIAAMLLFSCNPAAKIARKDDRALQRVLAKKALLDKAYVEAAKNTPCENVIVKYVAGKKDSIYIDKLLPVTDESAFIKKIADSLGIKFSNDYLEGMRQAAAAGYAECEAKWRKIKIPAPTKDTAWYEDGRKIDGYRKETYQLQLEKAQLSGIIQAMQSAEKGKIQIPWWFLLIIITVCFTGGFITSKFSK